MKISKKCISFLSCGMSFIIIGTTALCSSLIFNKNDWKDCKDVKPLNRGDNFEHFEIHNYLLNRNDLNNLITTYVYQEKYYQTFSEKTFSENFIKIIKDSLSKINKFKFNIEKYQFKLTYRINETKTSVLIDIVWYIPSGLSSYSYYDQFEIKLNFN